ncbi:MAG: hypothetical protein K9G62_03430 [Alphaproteobacteria bacterium]|nr:hypothetical protein [Alphaproteobacteria bacterium]
MQKFWALLTLVMAVAQFPASALSTLTGYGTSIEKISGNPTPEVPAGYAFGIWFLIFALAVVFSIQQFRFPAKTLYQDLRFPALTAFSAGTGWMIIAQLSGNGWWLVALILLMFGAAIVAYFIVLREHSLASFDRKITLPLFAILSAWLSVAIFLNLTSVIREQMAAIGFSDMVFALFSLIPAMITALCVIWWSKGYIWYSLTIAWALVGVLVTNLAVVNNIPMAGFAGAALLILGSYTLYARQKSPAPQGFQS